LSQVAGHQLVGEQADSPDLADRQRLAGTGPRTSIAGRRWIGLPAEISRCSFAVSAWLGRPRMVTTPQASAFLPREIERVLAEHPSVADLTVVGVPDDRWGEVPKAVVVAADGHTVDEAELLAYCREHLASYKCPKSGRRGGRAAAQPTGKILKKDVRARYWEGRDVVSRARRSEPPKVASHCYSSHPTSRVSV